MVDAGRQVTNYDYDADGNRTEIVSPGAASHPGGAETRRKTTTEYDGRGLPWRTTTSSADDQDKSITLQEYDANGNMVRSVNPSGVNSDGLPKVAFYGTIARTPDAAWHDDARDDDQDNQLTAIRFPWSREVSEGHPAVEDPQGPEDAEEHADDRRLVQRFRRGGPNNLLRRVSSVAAPHEADDELAPRTSYTYFENGWPETQSEERDRDPALSTSVEDIAVSFDYDEEGNQTEWRTRHAGQTADGRRVVRSFNDDGTLFERVAIKPLAGGDGDTRRTYRYTYNANRSLKGIFDYGDKTRAHDTDPVPDVGDNPRETRITRDAAEREHAVNERWAAGRDTMFEYDDNGNVKDRWTDGSYSSSGNIEAYGGPDAKITSPPARSRAFDTVDRISPTRRTHSGLPRPPGGRRAT